MEDLSKTKEKLFAKALENKADDSFANQMMNQQKPAPFNINLKTTDKGEVESVGGSAKLGDFSIGGSYNPGFTNRPEGAPSFIPDEQFKIPSSYNVGVNYHERSF